MEENQQNEVNKEVEKVLEVEKKVASILEENGMYIAVEPIYKVFLRPKK